MTDKQKTMLKMAKLEYSSDDESNDME